MDWSKGIHRILAVRSTLYFHKKQEAIVKPDRRLTKVKLKMFQGLCITDVSFKLKTQYDLYFYLKVVEHLCFADGKWISHLQVFEELLLDADWALNAGNWMWLSASAFFSQFYRVYCPVAFGKKTDKLGEYIR